MLNLYYIEHITCRFRHVEWNHGQE